MIVLKRGILVFLALLILGLLTAGCRDQDSFYSNANKVLVNSQKANSLTFRLALFSKNQIDEVTYIGLEGPDLAGKDYTVVVTGKNDGDLDNYTYRDFFIKYLTVTITPPENFSESCTITGIVLDVDGEQRSITLTTPLKHTFTGGNYSTEALSYAIPSEISAKLINDSSQSIPCMLIANEDLVLQKIYFTDFIEVAGVKVTVNGESVDAAALPISLKKEDNVVISVYLASTLADAYSYVSAKIFFEYTLLGEDTPLINSACLIFDPVYPINNGETAEIDKMIDTLFFE
jgi:hypothetical protein